MANTLDSLCVVWASKVTDFWLIWGVLGLPSCLTDWTSPFTTMVGAWEGGGALGSSTRWCLWSISMEIRGRYNAAILPCRVWKTSDYIVPFNTAEWCTMIAFIIYISPSVFPFFILLILQSVIWSSKSPHRGFLNPYHPCLKLIYMFEYTINSILRNFL